MKTRPSASGLRKGSQTLLSLSLMGAFILLGCASAYAADPFYEQLLRKGREALDRGDAAQAARRLRLACFGMLEEPPLLAECLVYLGVAQSALGDAEAFRESFLRIVEVEERFGALQRAALPPEVRGRYDQAAKALIPETTLRAHTAFAHLVPSLEQKLAHLSARERRLALERLVAQEGKNIKAHLLLAELEFSEKRFDRAIELAGGVLEQDQDNREALRLRGLALAAAKRWDKAAADLGRCACAVDDPMVAEALVEALGQLQRFSELLGFLKNLPQETQKRPAIARWRQKLAALSANTPTPSPKPEVTQPPQDRAGASSEGGPRPAPEGLSQVHKLLDQGRLTEALALARSLADQAPENRQLQLLAGEVAYRNRAWKLAVTYYRRAGAFTEPQHQFYFAVSLFESGEKREAQEVLRRCLQRVERNDFVDGYARKILGTARGGTP